MPKMLLVLLAALASCSLTGDSEPVLTDAQRTELIGVVLDHTGGGDVIEIEAGDEGGAYGVEVELDDGTRLDVEVTEDFEVLSSEVDDD